MGSTLTGSTVASTYTGLLKTSDTGAINSTLKTISDGSGNDSALQLSTTSVNIAAASGNFTIATDKLTVAGASGNTVVAGTLSATGNFAINTNKFTVAASSGNTACAGTLTSTGALNVASSASIVGNVTTNGFVILNGGYGIQQNSAGGTNNFAGPCNFTNLATFSGGIAFNSNVTLANNLTVNGTTTLNSVAALNGNITLGDSSADTLTVAATPTFSAPATFAGAATFNGNVTIGSDATDTLSINAAFNPPTETIASGDFILIQDVSDSNKIKKVAPTEVQFAKKYVSAEFALPSGNYDLILNVPISSTGLGGKPDMVVAQLVCQADNNGYVAGDVINMDTTVNGYYGNPYRLLFNENNIIVIRNTATTTWEAYGNVTGSLASFQINQDLTNWKARVVAIKFI